MKIKFGFLLLLCSQLVLAEPKPVAHKLDVRLDPAAHNVVVTDEIALTDKVLADKRIIFKLHANLRPQLLTRNATLELIESDASGSDRGMDQEELDKRAPVPLKAWRVSFDGPAPASLQLRYSGEIHHPIKQVGDEYARGFSQSPGIVDARGVYLAGSSYWVPSFGEEYLTYELAVTSPAGWRSVSQGGRVASSDGDDGHRDRWVVTTPTEEVFVIAAAFREYEYDVGAVKAMAFLRQPDDALANKYLETTAQYLEMYRNMLGPYPYSKFALVENFWETGYGMPSFTLLGEQIIRFPFILHSSYPHELLHNWWGNGVFVDFTTGNWCEGLTAYMADHLVAEQRGQGADYRRAILQRYTDYVTPINDFPLKDFRSRNSASSEAVGYGKSAMTWDMLRNLVGDEAFIKGFQRFYRDNRYRRASFDDIRLAFEAVSGKDLKAFFSQWVDRSGAPVIAVDGVAAEKARGGYRLDFTLKQEQAGDAFGLQVPVAVYSAGGVTQHSVEMTGKEQSFSLALEQEPQRIEIDPQFNLFRKLHYTEIPPSLSKAFGAEKVTLVLPAGASKEEAERYRMLAGIWAKEGTEHIQVVKDNELQVLPEDRSLWILGWNNRWRSVVDQQLKSYPGSIGERSATLGQTELSREDNSLVVAVRHPRNPNLAAVWLAVHDEQAVSGLAKKLPHYGKYSYLGFTGSEPSNIAKGEWPAVGSPLVESIRSESGAESAKLPKRTALAQLAPVFSGERMLEHVGFLADDKLKGRGLGTPELDEAADYIARAFERAGLRPAGDNGSYFQEFTVAEGPDGKPVKARNVVAVLPGTKPEWQEESVVVSAHYDHLGLGWPDAKSGNRNQIHNGADDNASGVAVLLELAQTMKDSAPQRNIVFAAFSAEEAGLLGARHYVDAIQKYPASKSMGIVNMDTVGSLGDKKLLVLNGASAREWQFIFMGTSFVTGVATEMVSQNIESSDQMAFIEAGVPGVQIFAGSSRDYHQPGDDTAKVDGAGLVKVATVVREVAGYLAERTEPMNFAATAKRDDDKPAQRGERRVSTGIMPDFAFSGSGLKVGGVAPESAAGAAGVQTGDVIVAIDGIAIASLREYSDLLKRYSPGDKIRVRYQRDGSETETTIALAAR